MKRFRGMAWVVGVAAVVSAAGAAWGQEVRPAAQRPARHFGGFACVDLKPLANDNTFDLYRIGIWSFSGFSQDLWKRHGVPFWYPRGLGNLRVAGPSWVPEDRTAVSSAECGGVAKADGQQLGNGAIANANDDDLSTYWYAGDDRPHGRLTIDLKAVERLASVRFLGWPNGRHATRDYRLGVILPDGREKVLAAVSNETRMGQWIAFDAKGVAAKGIYLDVTATVENKHGPVIYEFQARSTTPRKRVTRHAHPAEIVIPLGGLGAEELFVIGNVAAGRGGAVKAGTPVGRYVIAYDDGAQETLPLVAGHNVADLRWGSFVPEAEPAFILPDIFSAEDEDAVPRSYHLDEMLPLEPKKQLMMFGHRLRHPGRPLRSLTLAATDPQTALYLAAVTLRHSGPRLNALVYDGKRVNPVPPGTPRATPSMLDAFRDQRATLSLDGTWRYRTDPGNEGVRSGYFAADHDASGWLAMPVPSQWYVQGLDYHGVVWFRKDFQVPADFPGTVAELCFDGVDYDARVWLNGKYVGRHIGAYASFALDATDALRKGAVNTLVVRVDSPLDPGFNGQKTLIKGNAMEDIAMPYDEEGCMGGIFRPVRLRGRGDVAVEDAWTETALAADLKHADVKIRCALRPRRAAMEELTVTCSLREPGGTKRHAATVTRKLAAAPTTPVEITLPIDAPRLWYPWEQGEPYLYLLEIEVRRGGELLDRHVSRAGIRQVEFDSKTHCVLVNHHRIFLKGFLNDDVHWMSLMDRTGYRQRILMQKDAGVNTIRVVTHQSSPEFYDLCNEMGMMLWQEMPLQWGYSSSAPIREDIVRVVRDTVVQCRPHPSVIGWSAWNEGGQAEFSAKVVALMQSLDSTRPMSKASGGGDWDIHHYTNLNAGLARCTPLWCGVRFAFVSEVGSYGLPSPEEMRSMLGPELFRFGGVEYYWDTFNHYRREDGPLFLDDSIGADWSAEKIQAYMLARQPASERWLWQYMKFMFENFRGQRFAPTTAVLHCRFDDSFPSSHMAVVNFNGRPRKAYFSTKAALQPVLPILFFDTQGAEDLRVVNEYWHRGWTGCALRYTLKKRDGAVVRHVDRKFDLPPDATVKVLGRDEVGDVWRLPGFFAELSVTSPDGTVLSKNHYDLTADEIRDFVTNVYPPAPVVPLDGIVLQAGEATVRGAHRRVPVREAYSPELLALGEGDKAAAIEYEVRIAKPGEYLLRAACSPGEALSVFELTVDGTKVPREHVPYLNMAAGITRRPYSSAQLSWRPGWRTTLAAGVHKFVLARPDGARGPSLLLDAICVQRK